MKNLKCRMCKFSSIDLVTGRTVCRKINYGFVSKICDKFALREVNQKLKEVKDEQ